jgi:hypothetical protein
MATRVKYAEDQPLKGKQLRPTVSMNLANEVSQVPGLPVACT